MQQNTPSVIVTVTHILKLKVGIWVLFAFECFMLGLILVSEGGIWVAEDEAVLTTHTVH